MRNRARLPIEELHPYLLEQPEVSARFDWVAIFGNENPVEIEVGFGKGLFLLIECMKRQDVNFIGIEADRGLQLYTAGRIAKRKRPNVRLMKGDGRIIVRDCVAHGSVDAIHVYFPDPWWKKRHKKRRVFTPEFVDSCAAALRPGGTLNLATDVEEYFHIIQGYLNGNELQPIEENSGNSMYTNFARKAQEQGRPIWQARYVR